MSEISYLYIDGAYLRKLVESASAKYFAGTYVDIDPHRLTSSFRKSFYYDCLPSRVKGESEEDLDVRLEQSKKFFDLLRGTPGVHVFEGVIRGIKERSRQKQVDVKLAVDMLAHSYRRNMSKATLLAGDLDFKPVIDAIVQDGMYVTLWFDKASASLDLIYASDAHIEINVWTIYNLTTDEFKKQHAMPKPVHKQRDEQRSISPIAQGKSKKGQALKLYQINSEFILEAQNLQSRNQVIEITFHQRDILEEFFRDCYSDFTWDTGCSL
jgi:uncharacterized LabA/DUF88 family protein